MFSQQQKSLRNNCIFGCLRPQFYLEQDYYFFNETKFCKIPNENFKLCNNYEVSSKFKLLSFNRVKLAKSEEHMVYQCPSLQITLISIDFFYGFVKSSAATNSVVSF